MSDLELQEIDGKFTKSEITAEEDGDATKTIEFNEDKYFGNTRIEKVC